MCCIFTEEQNRCREIEVLLQTSIYFPIGRLGFLLAVVDRISLLSHVNITECNPSVSETTLSLREGVWRRREHYLVSTSLSLVLNVF